MCYIIVITTVCTFSGYFNLVSTSKFEVSYVCLLKKLEVITTSQFSKDSILSWELVGTLF